MANKLILKKSSVAAKVPLATDLEIGELAVNLADGKLYSKNAGGTVVLVGSGTAASGVTSVSGTAPIVSSGGNTPAISISAATTGAAGSMSAADKSKLDGIASGATANTGTVTSVSGTGTVSGLSLSGSVTTTGSLTLGGTLSASIDNITDEHRVFNNMGDNHSTRTAFDATTSSYNFGWRFVQGNTNSPGVNSATQYYSAYVGLGNDYPATGVGSYGMQIAFPRNVTNPYISIRYNEANALGAWQKISAGYADNAGAVPWSGVSSKPTTLSGFGITDATPSSHVGSGGTQHAAASTSVAGFMSAADKTKLDGVAAGATANTGTVTGVSGTAPIVSSGGTAPAISISAATTSAAGSMSAADKTKLDGIAAGATANTGTVTGVTGTAPIVSSGGAAPAISISAATTIAAGSMSAADKTKLDGIAAGAQVNTVTSVAGRTGAVTLAVADVSGAAPLATPTFTGTPAAPTAAVGTNTTQLATTAYVNAEIANDAPTKTGGGASGTWGISISGNAATASNGGVTSVNGLTGAVTVTGAVAGGAIYENSQAITANYTITSGKNALSAGPITINSGITVTVPSGSTWVVA